MITSALVKPFEHVPHLILFVPSFDLFRLLSSLLISHVFLFPFLSPFCSYAKCPMNEVVNPVHEIPVFYYLSYWPLLLFTKVLPPPQLANLVVLHYRRTAVMGGAGIASLSQSTLNHSLQ